MSDRVGERRHAEHTTHVDELAPTEYRAYRCYGQSRHQERSSPQARPVSHSTKRNGSKFPCRDLLNEPERWQKQERERDCLQPGKPVIPILPWPVKLQRATPL